MPLGHKIIIRDATTIMDKVILCAGEVVGTAILEFLGCISCVEGIIVPGGINPVEQISFMFGFAVMVAVQAFGHVSGCHINPIVTVAAATLGNISLVLVPIYFFGQFLGAIVGYALIMVVTPAKFMGNQRIRAADGTIYKTPGICSPGLPPYISPFQGFLVEFLVTLILALVCCGAWDSRNSNKKDSLPIRFGLTIAVLAMAAIPYTGAHMNPARSFAPALLNGDWKDHWLYWVGPLSAGFIGPLIYRFVFAKDPPKEEEAV